MVASLTQQPAKKLESEAKLSVNEAKVIKKIRHGYSLDEALSSTYKGRLSAIKGNLKKRERFQLALEHAGITDSRLAKVINEGMIATKPIVVRDKVIDYPDYHARHKYVTTILQLRDLIDKEDVSNQDTPLLIQAIQFNLKNYKA